MGMWFEIIPSIVIMTTMYVGGDAASKLILKSVYGVVSATNISVHMLTDKIEILMFTGLEDLPSFRNDTEASSALEITITSFILRSKVKKGYRSQGPR